MHRIHKTFHKARGELCPDPCLLKSRFGSRAACSGSESGGVYTEVGGGVVELEGGWETVHTAEKWDRLSAECAEGLWRSALPWDLEERSERDVHGGLRHGFLCVFPVCLMCSSGPGPVSCVWWVPGPGFQHKDNPPLMSETGPAAATHIRTLSCIYTQSLQNAVLSLFLTDWLGREAKTSAQRAQYSQVWSYTSHKYCDGMVMWYTRLIIGPTIT